MRPSSVYAPGIRKLRCRNWKVFEEAIVRFALDAWEPTLSVDVWKTMWQVLQQLLKDSRPPSEEWANRAEAVHRRICRVDMLSGLDMEGKHQSARVER